MKLIKLDSCSSTNDELKKLAAGGAGSMTMVTSKTQENGRGRNGREWESAEGNLYLSILLRDLNQETAHQLPLIAALAAVETIESYLLDDDVELKWPNDVLIDGKKIAGILCESEFAGDKLEYVIIGIGLNVESAPDYATSLKKRGSEQNLNDVRDLYIDAFQEYMELWLTEGFERIGNLWMQNAAYLDDEISVNNGEFKGIFKGLNERGEMLLEVDGLEQTISFGEINAASN